jgi:hypothetical protein
MKRKEYILSQSSLKEWEEDDVCLEKWKQVYVTKEVRSLTNEAMDKGHYFEYWSIGGTATDNGEVTELPKKKNGDEYIDTVRINEQIETFKELFNPNSPRFIGLRIVDTQVRLNFGDESGVIDMVCEDVYTKEIVLVDLKLTKDALSTRNKYGWGHDRNIDITQALHYTYLYEKNNGFSPKFIFLVFDYSPRKVVKDITVIASDDDLEHLSSRKEAAKEFVRKSNLDNVWDKNPTKRNCSTCPIQCNLRFKS